MPGSRKKTDMGEKKTRRSGVVAIVGRPNVGKSTLLNQFLGQKISIVSSKAQTTRQRVLGILTGPEYQIVFIDTPGVIRPRDQLQKLMVQSSLKAVSGADLAILIVDASSPNHPADRELAESLHSLRTERLLAINKVDLVHKAKILPLIDEYAKMGAFEAIVPLSALVGDGLKELLGEVVQRLPEGEFLYSEEQIATQPLRFFATELIRETLFELLSEELPYSSAVELEEYKERPGNKAYIRAVIYVERDSQKAIVIGHGGEMLKKIGQAARAKIELIAEQQVYLELWVKVKDKWRKNESFLRQVGYDSET
jgi:GTPase